MFCSVRGFFCCLLTQTHFPQDHANNRDLDWVSESIFSKTIVFDMAALEKRLKEFQKKAGNKNCFVCNQKVRMEEME